MPHRALCSLSLGAALLAALTPIPVLAAWPHNPGINLPVSTAANSQSYPTITSDGAGGAIVTWVDFRTGTNDDIYAQHVLASGMVDPAWPANGRALCTEPSGQSLPTIASDGAGGAIITWFDIRSGLYQDIYAQHVLASGAVDPAWPVNGRALCTAGDNQVYPTIVSDGTGGAIVTWEDYRSGTNRDVYGQHVLGSGAVDPAWPVDGRALCTAVGDQFSPAIGSDGAGGAIVTWYDNRSGNYDIYAQHVLASGTVDGTWPVDGRALCTAVNVQQYPTIVSDGASGAIVTWQDYRSGSNDIYAQHVLASGTVDGTWPVDGRGLCTALDNQVYPTIVSDGAGGAIVTWSDHRSGTSYDIYAQHVLASGAVDGAWPVDGRALSTATDNQFGSTTASDGAGGAIATWQDYRSGTNDVYAQHVLASGAVDPAWPMDGRALCTATLNQSFSTIVSDGAGGAIVTWQDDRSGTADIYAQRVARFGYLGTPEAEIISVRDVPNDNGGRMKLSWYPSWLDTENDPNLYQYEIYRSVPPNVAASALADGARLLGGPDQAPEPGSRAILAATEGATVYAWEYLATQYAVHYLPAYSYLAATASDSSGAYNPKTAFMIVARDISGSKYWLSRPDSGYSVDNIAPIAPSPFVGQYSAGSTHLHWGPNPETDLANYRLYRGGSASFVPGPGNLIASPADTGYADPGPAGSYYKLSAVDIHGNESGFALLTPAQIAGVGPAPTVELALSRPSPNPAAFATIIGFALPRATRVRLAIYDPLGRRTRVLVNGSTEAGVRTLPWDLRDDAGHPVPSGLYVVRLEAEGRVLTQRLAAIR